MIDETLKSMNANQNQDLRPVLTQSEIERQMLDSAKQGLLATLNWKTDGATFTRKLSSLRFAARTFREHLERALAIEEHDGYMDFVLECCPQHSDTVTLLRNEHDQIRGIIELQMTKLERLMPDDLAGLEELHRNILDVLRKYDEHTRRETKLIQDALTNDYGTGD